MLCPNCERVVTMDYDIYNNAYWHCVCSVYSWLYICCSNKTNSMPEVTLSTSNPKQDS